MSVLGGRQRLLGPVLAGAVLVAALGGALVYYFTRSTRVDGPLSEPEGVPVGEWTQWRGPARAAVSRETELLAQWPADAATALKVWERPGVKGYAALAVAHGRA